MIVKFRPSGVLVGALMSSFLILCASAATKDEFDVAHARTLSDADLARALLWPVLGAKIVEVDRYEYEAGDTSVPECAEFFTRPSLTDPRLNGICRTDVITVEYNWPEIDTTSMNKGEIEQGGVSAGRLTIAHVQAAPRYKSFPIPLGEPGTPENEEAQASICARMPTARDAFRAPSAGDAQWLAEIEQEYANPKRRFEFTCDDFADARCASAGSKLARLRLGPKTAVERFDCPPPRTGNQIDRCYRIAFPYSSADEYSDRQDQRDAQDYSPEWVITVFAGMRDGLAPVKIRSLALRHVQKPLAMP